MQAIFPLTGRQGGRGLEVKKETTCGRFKSCKCTKIGEKMLKKRKRSLPFETKGIINRTIIRRFNVKTIEGN